MIPICVELGIVKMAVLFITPVQDLSNNKQITCGLATPWRHQAMTWTNADLSSVKSSGIHWRALSWEDLKIPISATRSKIPFLESHSDLPRANELIILVRQNNLGIIGINTTLHFCPYCILAVVIFGELIHRGLVPTHSVSRWDAQSNESQGLCRSNQSQSHSR